MATQILSGSGNLTNGSVFGAAETGTSAIALARNNTTTLASNTAVSSPTFTVTNAKVIDGVMLSLMATAAAPAGTLLVELQKGGVTQASVTVNCADLPHSATGTNDVLAVVPLFFRFTGTATGDGGSNWTVKLTTSNNASATITYQRNSATTGDFWRALRTQTNGNPSANDNLYVLGELTGAGTHTSRTLTMNAVAASFLQYGNGTVATTTVNGGEVIISCYGSLAFGTTSSTSYYFQVKGNVEVFWNGTFDSSLGDRTSSNILELVMNAASADFSFTGRNLSTITSTGLTRTSGKTVVKTSLTSNVTTGSNNLLTAGTTSNATATTNNGPDWGGSKFAESLADTASNTTHFISFPGTSVSGNTTQTADIWLARGSGTNNRFVRVLVGDSASAAPTNGFFADVDLQAGTIGTCTSIGNGTATSASITAQGTGLGAGFLISLTGKVSSATATPRLVIAMCSAATTVTFAGAANIGLYFNGGHLLTASSIADTTYNVADDTGWKSGDLCAIASTSRTYSDCQTFVLSADAGASSIVTHLYPFGINGSFGNATLNGSFLGTAPTQAEIILLTRGVQWRSNSLTLWGYIYFEPLCSVTISHTEFYYLGNNASNQYGIIIAGPSSGTATAKSFTYCSLHDMVMGFYVADGTARNSVNLTCSNNTSWNITVFDFFSSNGVTLGDYTADHNTVVRPARYGFLLKDPATVTNNIVSGIGGSTAAYWWGITTIGTFSGNVSHSCANVSIDFEVANGNIIGVIDGHTAWNHNSWAIYQSQTPQAADLTFNNITLFGNTIGFRWLATILRITGTNICCGTTTFAQSVAIQADVGTNSNVLFDIAGMDFSGSTLTGGIGASNTAEDFNLTNATDNSLYVGYLPNCKFSTTIFSSLSFWSRQSFFSMQKYNQVAGDHRDQLTYGILKNDSTFYHSLSPSMRMTPNSSSSSTLKLESAPVRRGITVAVANGSSVNVSVWVRKSAAGDGAAYNGNQPRLIQRASPALGQATDVVLATYSAGTGSWNQLTGTSSTATDDGVWEFIVDCDGSAGWINVDDWSPNPAKNWWNGLPIRSLSPPNPAPVIVSRGTPY